MINSIYGGNYVIASGSKGSMPYINMSNYMAGSMRYNSNTCAIEVYDGHSWLQLNHEHVNVELTGSASSAITWALTKMNEEAELQQMIKDRPAVLAAYEAFKRAGEQLKTTIILSKNEQSTS